MDFKNLHHFLKEARDVELLPEDDADMQVDTDLDMFLRFSKIEAAVDRNGRQSIIVDFSQPIEALKCYLNLIVNYTATVANADVIKLFEAINTLHAEATPEAFYSAFPEALKAAVDALNAKTDICAHNVNINERDLALIIHNNEKK